MLETVFGQEVPLSGKVARRVEKFSSCGSPEDEHKAFKTILREAERFTGSVEASSNDNGHSANSDNGRSAKKVSKPSATCRRSQPVFGRSRA